MIPRKDKQNAGRVQEVEQNGLPPPKRLKLQYTKDTDKGNHSFETEEQFLPELYPREPTARRKPKSILKTARPLQEYSKVLRTFPSSPLPKKLRESVAIGLMQEDAEIAALEKKLGIKGKKRLPRAFRDDGLEELLEGLDGHDGLSIQASIMDQAAGEWLAQKRSQAKCTQNGEHTDEKEEESGRDDESGLNNSAEETALDSVDDFEGFGSESDGVSTSLLPRRTRENPYIAPTSLENPTPLKYVPPPLRESPSDPEVLVQLRRRTQGLVNRLTEANLISILGDVEKLYRENARHLVTSTLVDLLIVPVCDPTILPDTLIILSAGFMAAIYKIIGTDFGVQAIERVVRLFDEYYTRATRTGNGGPATSTSENTKETSNLITLLAELYNFQVVGSNIIFDYIRLFLRTLSELNAELLLKIIRVSGMRLRQDDPSSLRDIVAMLRPAISGAGEQNLSVRTKFMIESINGLKNNRLKTGAVASTIMAEHTVRMKKTLGTLNTRNIKASEPLRIGLRDIQESDKKGKWWRIGASWTGNIEASETNFESEAMITPNAHNRDTKETEGDTLDLIQLAREQRMNTHIRRAIFVTVMSASDYQDAYCRLMKLKLKKVQELEIPKVIIHCASAETHYNPYYTLVIKMLCGDRKLRMAVQFSLWDLFKRLGEDNYDGDAAEDIDNEENLDTRQLVNLAKMFGALIADGSISLGALKNLNFRYLQSKTKMFVEVLLVTALLQSQQQSRFKRDEQAVIRIVSKAKDAPSMIRGLQHFLTKVVARTDIAAGETETATVKWASGLAVRALGDIIATAL